MSEDAGPPICDPPRHDLPRHDPPVHDSPRLDPPHCLRDQFGHPVRVESSVVHVMALCETEFLILHPHQLYLFVPVPGCARCALLAEHAPTPGSASGTRSD